MDPRRSTAVLSQLWFGALVFVVLPGGCALIVAIMVPQLLGTGERSRTPHCDGLFVALSGEVANELDRTLFLGTTSCGTTGGPAAVIDCTLGRHTEENPLRPGEPAYGWADVSPGPVDSCRVGLAPLGTNGVRFSQYVRPESAASRTFSVVID